RPGQWTRGPRPIEGRRSEPRETGGRTSGPYGMKAVRYRLRLELRRGWRACVALGVVVGIIGGTVLALAAGARRTDSAYRRFVKAQDAYDILLSLDTSTFDNPSGPSIAADDVRR